MPYRPVENERRHRLVQLVNGSPGMTIRMAAQHLGIKFTTAKSILKVWRRDGRIDKKAHRERKGRTPLLPLPSRV